MFHCANDVSNAGSRRANIVLPSGTAFAASTSKGSVQPQAGTGRIYPLTNDTEVCVQHYEARFPDGHAVRKRSMRPYSFAWRVHYRINGSLRSLTGFAISQERAEEATAGHTRTMSGKSSRSVFVSSEIVTTQSVPADEPRELAA